MKKMIAGAVMAAAMAAVSAVCVSAAGVDKVDIQGIIFEIPEEIRDLVTVETQGLDQDTLVCVSETASRDAALASGEEVEGAGWLFSIARISEEKMNELRCGSLDGMTVFAEDDDFYFVFQHPTDVRFVREQYEDIDEDMAQWSRLNEWANDVVIGEIMKNNPELDSAAFSNTELDMFLARAAFRNDTKFVLRTLEFGGNALDPSKLNDDEYIEDLTDDVTYEELFDAEAPDGEYIVMDFEEEGIRFDFFFADKTLIREVYTIDGEEFEKIFRAHFEENDETTTDIMQEWCRAIANA